MSEFKIPEKERKETIDRIMKNFKGKTFSNHDDFSAYFERAVSAAYSDGYIDCNLDYQTIIKKIKHA